MNEIQEIVNQFFLHYPLRSYSKGQILIHADDSPQYIYYIVKGRARQYDISYRGDEVVVNSFKEGAFFPMQWAITGIDNKFFYDVDEDLEVRIAPADDVVEFLRQHPEVTYDLLRRVYIGADGLLNKLVHVMSGSAMNRILYELVIECRRFGKKIDKDSYEITLNEQDVAIRAGVSRETVSREFKKIKGDLNISVSHTGIHIGSLKKLEAKLAKTF